MCKENNNIKRIIIEKTKKINNNIFKKCKFPFIMCIISFIVGYIFILMSKGEPLKEKLLTLLIGYIPFIIYLLITIFSYYFNHKKIVKTILNVITGILTAVLIMYYFIALFICVIIAAVNPITNIKYYNDHVSGTRLLKVFPKEIPDNVDNIQFYYAPGVLQGSTNYSLYYVDKNLTMKKFDKKYKDKAIWIGHIDEHIDFNVSLAGAFYHTPSNYKNEDDYIIYLVEGHCYKPDSCNHGDFLFAAYNEKTNEVIFRSEDW